jgi:hypothetical protein
VIGTNVQAYDAELAAIAGLAVTDGNIIVGNGTTWVAESGSTARTSLGLGTLATQDASSVTVTALTATGDVTIADKIVHDGDTNTAIRFPAADIVTVETGGAERLRVSSGGLTVYSGLNLEGTAPVINLTDISGVYTASITNLFGPDLEIYPPFGQKVGFVGDVKFYNAIIETVYALSGTTPALNPSNGTIQTWTLSGNSTPTDSFVAGESMTLMVDDGSARTITWPSVTWKTDGGVAPTLNTTGFTAIVLWKVGSTLYGARVGNA